MKASGTHVKLDIAKAKWSRIAGGNGVFTWAKEEEEGNATHISNSKISWSGRSVSHKHDAAQNLNRDRFDAVRWRILTAECRVGALKAEIYFALRREPGVRLTQTRERLGNMPYGIFNGACADRLALSREEAGAIALGKDLEEGDSMRAVWE
jgi:hypothetical protein